MAFESALGMLASMEPVLSSDLERLKKFAFRRRERCGPILRRFYKNRFLINSHSDSRLIWRVYHWLRTPLSLWPIDFEGLAKHLLCQIEENQEIGEELGFLLNVLGDPPDAETQSAVAAFEHIVETGKYDCLVNRPEKFAEGEAAIREDEELSKTWQNIKARWDIAPHQNPRGVIRRRLSQERNLRGDWGFEWTDPKKRFELVFDAMCYRWKLYGMEKDNPLLLKVSVNPTPHGTMILIPRHWSLDPVRDLNWKRIRKLHRAYGASRQGPKLSMGRIQKRSEALQVLKLWNEARAMKIRGEGRYDYVHAKLKKDGRTDHSWVKRLLRIGRKLGGADRPATPLINS